jgi:Fe(3+) dicitrate transport protein
MKSPVPVLLTTILVVAVSVAYSSPLPPDTPGNEQSATSDTMRTYTIPQVDVIGRVPTLLDLVPGSGKVLTMAFLNRIDPLSGNEVFRQVPGLHPVDEEGAGLRLNLGIRGLEPDRSRTVLILEDGVPVALAPYGEPEMYYTPSMDRMSTVEVLKGSGSILFGPQTIGGVINYITADPPETPSGSIHLRAGEHGIFTNLLKYGTTSGNVGVQVNYLRRQADNVGTTRFRINDLSAKFKLAVGSNSVLGVKLAAYDENSNSTYIGLTQAMYDNGEYYTAVAPDDQLLIRRYFASATYNHVFSSSFTMRTTAFGYTTTRDWRRQDFDRAPNPSRQYLRIFGDTTVAGGALYMRNSTGNRNRQFEVAGIEPRFHFVYAVGGMRSELDFGARFLYERAFEQLVLGTTYNSTSGNLRDDEIRTGYATSAFAQNRLFATENLIITPGVRIEVFDYDRNIMRGQFNINGTNMVRDTSLITGSSLTEVIPGIGISYRLGNGSSVFAGVHRGFAPPRIKDAITNAGQALDLDAELSWNYELGARFAPLDGITLEATAFLLDFSNQIIPVSQSSGGTGTGLVNGGRSRHSGVEAGASFDLGKLMGSSASVILASNATYVNAVYNADRFVTRGSEVLNIRGNTLPYAPKFTVSNSLAVTLPFGFNASFCMLYVDKQFADELNTVVAPPNGLIGVIPSHTVLNFSAGYLVPALNSRFSISVKNVADERYIVTRRPTGIRAGLPRTFVAGIDVTL